MCLEVGAFAVDLGATRVVALVTLPEHRTPHSTILLGLSVHHRLFFNVILVQTVIVDVGDGLLLDLCQIGKDTGNHVAGGNRRRPLTLLPLSRQVQGSVVLVTRVKHGQQTLRGEVYVLVHPGVVGGALEGRLRKGLIRYVVAEESKNESSHRSTFTLYCQVNTMVVDKPA